ncbi:BatD family protein [Azotobacter vinelandii]|uniref:BatD family protein n=1 Tax=Azotobacter vinelandii TaxID=354 RepID=UPI000774C8F0|nr:BatD family protein [Azotobacter vinelandii]
MNRLLCTLLLCLLAWTVQGEELTARVDRTRLDAGETLELTLESTDPAPPGKPDLGPLEAHFEVLGTRQVNRPGGTGGESPGTIQWLVTLQPRHPGQLTIPPLRLGDRQTQAIVLHVRESEVDSDPARLAPVFIDASLDRESTYVQAQVVLTLRIYHSVSLYDDSSLSPLQMADARIEALGAPRTYETSVNGVRHGVIEMRYAVFPQRSGQLLIPAQAFTATEVSRLPDRDGLLPFGPHSGRQIRVESPAIPLTVKAKPAEYPADAPWLPARSLVLNESWSPAPEQARAGESLTRHLTLRADGLSGAQLPPLAGPPVEGLRRYPEQPQLASQAGERGLIGSREEREALVPTRDGRIELPAQEVLWWNTAHDRLERTRLPARTLTVAENPALAEEQPQPIAALRPPPWQALWAWQLASSLLFCTTLLGFALWWRARRQPAVLRSAAGWPSPRLLDDLRRACQANDTQATRQALDAWARQQPETLAAMAARFVPLSDALDGLNGALYSESGQRWQGEDLWQAIRDLPPAQDADTARERSQLPPLYPR